MAYPQKNQTSQHELIIQAINAGDFKPIYFLYGEESYFIDKISDLLVEKLLQPEERDFNLITFFGADNTTTTDLIINTAKGFPMGAQRLVVLVKEAQHLTDIERLEFYLKQPQPSSVVIFCCKKEKVDKRKKVFSMISQQGVLFESPKYRDYQLRGFINDYFRQKNKAIQPEAAEMLAEYVGADLNRLAGEMDKLLISLPESQQTVDKGLVADNIGMSREFNVFELQNALIVKDVEKAMKIAEYFEKSPKENPPQKYLPSLFKFFSNLMLAFYAPTKTEAGIADWLGLQGWQVRNNVLPAMSKYSAAKTMKILGEIRKMDARTKGVGNPSISNGDLMKELMFFILH